MTFIIFNPCVMIVIDSALILILLKNALSQLTKVDMTHTDFGQLRRNIFENNRPLMHILRATTVDTQKHFSYLEILLPAGVSANKTWRWYDSKWIHVLFL